MATLENAETHTSDLLEGVTAIPESEATRMNAWLGGAMEILESGESHAQVDV